MRNGPHAPHNSECPTRQTAIKAAQTAKANKFFYHPTRPKALSSETRVNAWTVSTKTHLTELSAIKNNRVTSESLPATNKLLSPQIYIPSPNLFITAKDTACNSVYNTFEEDLPRSSAIQQRPQNRHPRSFSCEAENDFQQNLNDPRLPFAPPQLSA